MIDLKRGRSENPREGRFRANRRVRRPGRPEDRAGANLERPAGPPEPPTATWTAVGLNREEARRVLGLSIELTVAYMKGQTILVGQAPGRTGGARHPLNPLAGAGKRLREAVGLDLRAYLRAFARFNLLPAYPGRHPNGRGDRFPFLEAAAAARDFRLALRWAAHATRREAAGRDVRRRVVLLGRNVARAWAGGPAWDREVYAWRDDRRAGCRVALAPHPSGASRALHAPEDRARFAAFFRGLTSPPETPESPTAPKSAERESLRCRTPGKPS